MKIFTIKIDLMSGLTLESIIQKSYNDVLIGKAGQNYDKLSKFCGHILADIYDIYESNKDKANVTELRMFLNIRDPIKHLISILNKFVTGAMTIKNAIIDEIKIIKNLEHLVMKKITFIEVIEDEIKETENNRNHIRNLEGTAQAVIDRLTIERINGNLHHDAETALMMPEIKTSLINIIKKVKEGNDLKDVIFSYYKNLDEKKRSANTQLDFALAHFKEEMVNLIRCEFDDVHQHVDGMGRQIHGAVVGNVITEINPSPHEVNNHHHYLHQHDDYDSIHRNNHSSKMVPNSREIRSSHVNSSQKERSVLNTHSLEEKTHHRQQYKDSLLPTSSLYD